MRIIKSLLAFLLVLGLSACAGTDVKEPIKVLAPLGAPSVSLLGLYGDENVTVDTVDGANVLSAELTKDDSDYDMIVAPINLGATMIEKGKSDYLLDSVVTWGNLYLVGTDEKALTQEGMFAAFGEKAVPQKVLSASLDLSSITPKVTYFASVNEVQQQLLAKKANVALMAEPAATATIAKAKEKGVNLTILKDLQKEYQAKNETASYGYPQAAIFVKKEAVDKVAPYLEQAKAFIEDTAVNEKGAIEKAVETATPEKLGVPNAKIIEKTWERQNIKFVKANTVKDDINTFLKQFNLVFSDTGYTK